ncbi:MAG TPA: NTP transferase domain-containing protein [Polyangiales bacterium]|nr:NTP transferase domain-containing protein [Polyangiales bacterium]
MSEAPTIAILAGGLATRLGELVANTPKALLDVLGRPFLAWQLDMLQRAGLADVVICAGHLADQIEGWVDAHAPTGMRVRICRDGPRALGTGGALRQALPLLTDPFLVVYGDSYLRCDYLDVYRHFVRERQGGNPPLALMTVFQNDNLLDTSNVVFRDGRIVRYDKRARSEDMRHIDWGLGILSHQAFEAFAQQDAFDLAAVYQRLVERGRLSGYEVTERFYEIGSRSGLAELREHLHQQGKV